MSRLLSRRIRGIPYGLYNMIDFGKHEGRHIRQIIQDDPDYLVWCLENVSGFELTDEADEVLEDRLEGLK